MGSWTLYHGPFSLSIRAAGWGKIAPGSSSGKAPSGCCNPRKAGDFEAENNRVRHRFAGVRHGLAEAGEAAFLSCSMMGDTTTGKSPFHARATVQNRAQKKGMAPLRKKRGFSLWALLVAFLDIPVRIPHARARKGGHQFSDTPHGGLRYHCTRGKCAKLCA